MAFYHQPLVFRAAKDNKMCRYAPAGMWKTVWKTFFESLEHDYCHAVFALAVNAEPEALDIRRLAQILVDGAPKPVKEAAAKEEAEEIKKKLEAAGAKVTLK